MTDAAAAASWPFDAHADSAVTVRFSNNNANTATPPRWAVAYWSIRGLAAPIRMMLCAAKQDHVVYMYDLLEDGGTGGGWTSGYFADKARIKTTYAADGATLLNLPYIIDQDEKLVLSQTNACLEYLGDSLGMMGRNAVERAHCAQLLCEIYDWRCVMTQWAYNGAAASDAAATVARAGPHLAKLEQCLAHKGSGTAKHCLVGDSLSAPDFHLFEIVDQFEALCRAKGLPALLEKFPHLQAFQTGFAQLP